MSAVLLDEADGIATLRLNRPDKLNALADETTDALLAGLDRVAASGALVLVLTGEGRGFCAGFDLSLAAATGADGTYSFANLAAGTYRATVNPATLPANLAQTFDVDGVATANTADLALTASRSDVDFGYRGR